MADAHAKRNVKKSTKNTFFAEGINERTDIVDLRSAPHTSKHIYFMGQLINTILQKNTPASARQVTNSIQHCISKDLWLVLRSMFHHIWEQRHVLNLKYILRRI